MEKRELTCINCPIGCKITIELEDNGNDCQVSSIQGNRCPKGEVYARKEVTDPRRIVTSTVVVIGGEEDRVPVKTAEDIPKGKIFDCARALKNVWIEAPVRIGDVIVENVAETGVDVVATKNVSEQTE